MELTPWNPWQEIERVQEEMADLLGAVLEKLRRSLPGRPITFVPVIDIIEVTDEYRVYISLPGIVEEDVDIAIDGDILTIRGEREPPYDAAQAVLHQRQWRYGYFERRLKLPEPLHQDAIRAAYEAGVLTIRIRKPLKYREGEGEVDRTGGPRRSAEATGGAPEAGQREESTGGAPEARQGEEAGQGEEARQGEDAGQREETGQGEDAGQREETGQGEDSGRREETGEGGAP